MILNDFSKKYRIITPDNLKDTAEGFVVTPHCFNYIGQRFPVSHEHVIFWDGNKFYSGARIVHIEEVEFLIREIRKLAKEGRHVMTTANCLKCRAKFRRVKNTKSLKNSYCRHCLWNAVIDSDLFMGFSEDEGFVEFACFDCGDESKKSFDTVLKNGLFCTRCVRIANKMEHSLLSRSHYKCGMSI